MSLKAQINQDLKAAMKARHKEKTSVLRMLLSELKYAQAATNVHEELSDEEVLQVISTYHKRLVKSLEDFPEGDRREAVRGEIGIIETYLPQKASPEEVRQTVDRILEETDERSFGPLMKKILAELGAAADGKLVSQVLKGRLSEVK